MNVSGIAYRTTAEKRRRRGRGEGPQMGRREDEAAKVRILSVERASTRDYGGFLFFFFFSFLLRRPKVTRVTRVALEGCARSSLSFLRWQQNCRLTVFGNWTSPKNVPRDSLSSRTSSLAFDEPEKWPQISFFLSLSLFFPDSKPKTRGRMHRGHVDRPAICFARRSRRDPKSRSTHGGQLRNRRIDIVSLVAFACRVNVASCLSMGDRSRFRHSPPH